MLVAMSAHYLKVLENTETGVLSSATRKVIMPFSIDIMLLSKTYKVQ